MYLDLIYGEYLIYTFVKCEPGKQYSVIKEVTNETAIITKGFIREKFVILVTDSDSQQINEDKQYLTELLFTIAGVENVKHQVRKRNA